MHAAVVDDESELVGNEFSYGLFDANGVLVSTGVNDKNGVILFKELTYSTPGEYHYVARQIDGDTLLPLEANAQSLMLMLL
ncbi:hypothetical protein [Lactobacillus crispatus]|uniref:Uncharacterized protein n=1 Tax=Lactobacillus crispatus TaxID=47770 RepID=A0A7H9E7F9_9LACO|nr:hypothetical protein [Lactobacillus crispatus]QLL73581.1 hypothetical protein GTO85_03990 [Lactobacillus crispatus]